MSLEKIYKSIVDHPENKEFKKKNWKPVYSVSDNSKIIIVGQAPGRKAQESSTPWNDQSGERLRKWLGVSREEFYNVENFALLPMDFYYPGKGVSGDLPPRKNFAQTWHPQIFELVKNVQLIILVGAYSQKYYLQNFPKTNLTETVKNYQNFLPKFFPLVHPSPLTSRWLSKNKWFEETVVRKLQKKVKKILSQNHR